MGWVCVSAMASSESGAHAQQEVQPRHSGTGEHDEMTVLEWGQALDTIGEELVCRIGSRVQRVYEGHSVEGRVGEYLWGEHG